MAPELDFHKQEHPCKGQACRALCHQPQEETDSRQPAAFTTDLLRSSPNYRGTSGFSVSLSFQTLLLKKKKNAHFFIECHSGRKSGLQFLDLNLQKLWNFLIKAPHNLKVLHILIIQFQNTTLIAQGPHEKAPSQQDSHRFPHEGQQGALLPSFLPGWPPGF